MSDIEFDLSKDDVLEAAKEEVAELLETKWNTIWNHFKSAFVAYAEDEKEKSFSMPLKVAVILSPEGKDMRLDVTCAYGLRRKHIKDPRIVQLRLPMDIRVEQGGVR